MVKAYADYPPEGLEMSSGPVSVHSRAELKKRAAEALAVAEGAEVRHIPNEPEPEVEEPDKDYREAPEYDPAEAEAAARATTTPDVVEVEPVVSVEEAPAPATNDAKQKAKSLMLQVTKSGVSVADLKAKLSEAIPGVDTAHYNEDQYAKAVEVMEGMLNARSS
jgi:hypothetical protein